MKPGSELDALVAGKVMGGTLEESARYECWDEPPARRMVLRFPDGQCYWSHRGDWSPSTDPAAALEVESKLGEGYYSERYSDPPPNDRVWRYLEELHKLVGHPIGYDADFGEEWAILRATPYQRCLAALKAFGVEVPQ